MLERIENQQHRIVGQFPDGSLGYQDHLVSVLEHPEPDGFPLHAVRMDNVLTGEFQRMGLGNTRLAAFQQAYGDLEGRERYELWREHQREEAIHEVVDIVDPLKNGERRVEGIILEGPPIYLYPRPDHPTEYIGSPTAVEGWHVLDEIGEAIGDENTLHYAMVDEFNGRPGDVLFIDSSAELKRLAAEAGLSGLHIFQTEGESAERGLDGVFSETSFVKDPNDDYMNSCQFLDASFQMQKIESQLTPDMSLVDAKIKLERTLMVVVHPTTFQKQQVAMLSAVLREMKDHALLKALPKQARMDLLSRMYVHIWVDESGDVVGVTRPAWNKDLGKFEHAEISNEVNKNEN